MKTLPKISLLIADVDGTLLTRDKTLTKRAREAVSAFRDAGIRFANVTHVNANEGYVADYLSRALGIPCEEIATIGDRQNDVLMSKRSGFGMAMGKSTDDAKRRADAVTDSVR